MAGGGRAAVESCLQEHPHRRRHARHAPRRHLQLPRRLLRQVTGFYLVMSGFPWFLLLSLTRSSMSSLAFTEFYWVLPSFTYLPCIFLLFVGGMGLKLGFP